MFILCTIKSIPKATFCCSFILKVKMSPETKCSLCSRPFFLLFPPLQMSGSETALPGGGALISDAALISGRLSCPRCPQFLSAAAEKYIHICAWPQSNVCLMVSFLTRSNYSITFVLLIWCMAVRGHGWVKHYGLLNLGCRFSWFSLVIVLWNYSILRVTSNLKWQRVTINTL